MNSIYIGDNTAICMTKFGKKIFVDTRDNSLAPHIMLEGSWENEITDAITPFLRGATFFDIGANFGWYSMLAAKCGAKRIFAFEPNSRLYELLRRTRMVNGLPGRMEIFRSALSDRSGIEKLFFDQELLGSSSLHPISSSSGSTEVCVTTFDEQFRGCDWEGEALVLKFDIEGYEARALLGAQETLKKYDCTVFLEHHTDHTGENRLVDMLDFLEAESYQLGHVTHESQIRTITRADLSGIPDVDMLCFRRFAS